VCLPGSVGKVHHPCIAFSEAREAGPAAGRGAGAAAAAGGSGGPGETLPVGPLCDYGVWR